MNKVNILKILNVILGLLIINQALTGLMHDFLNSETFELIHEGGGISLVLGIVLHVILNYKWIRINYFSKKVPVR
jgi:hypothetical protein